MKLWQKISLGFFGICLIALPCVFTYWMQHPQKNPQTIVMIQKGESLAKISSLFKQHGVIDYPLLFKGLVVVSGDARNLKAGEYLIPPSITPLQLIHILTKGEVILHPVTLIEGETVNHLIQRLLKDDRFEGLCDVPHEGSLLPNTYHFPRNAKREDILKTMKSAMNKTLNNLWPHRSKDSPLKTPEEALILASIVEKETALAQERPLVAAVFLNRLKQEMPLQADPTVIYALTEGLKDLERDLTREDLTIDHPFNTYIHKGLPPLPIANPGLASLKAVLNPAPVSYLYFVADGAGGHVFSDSYPEHKKNHATWRKVRSSK